MTDDANRRVTRAREMSVWKRARNHEPGIGRGGAGAVRWRTGRRKTKLAEEVSAKLVGEASQNEYAV